MKLRNKGVLEKMADTFCSFSFSPPLILVKERSGGFISSDIGNSSLFQFCLGKAAILEIETKSYEKESGELLCMNR